MSKKEIKNIEENQLFHQLEKNNWPVRNNPKCIKMSENSQILIGTNEYPFVIYVTNYFIFYYFFYFINFYFLFILSNYQFIICICFI